MDEGRAGQGQNFWDTLSVLVRILDSEDLFKSHCFSQGRVVNNTGCERGITWNRKVSAIDQDKCEIRYTSREYRRKASGSSGPIIITNKADDVPVWTGKCYAQCETSYVVHLAVGQGKVQRVL
jgi:hypothetical protein